MTARILPALAVLLLAAACAPEKPAAPGPEAALPDLEKTLLDNIAGFWYPRSIDRDNGGYRVNFGPAGEALDPGPKMIVTQARMLWFFSRLAREGYSKPGAFEKQDLLNAAEWGFHFLRDKMWDAAHGGFFWMVDARGDGKLAPKKHLYGQAFALYALSEYYLASGHPEAIDLANRLFALMEEKSHDPAHKGYIEFFNADWSPVPASEPGYMDRGRSDLKLMNTHLHLLEAMTAYYRASRSEKARERLVELIGIETAQVVRQDLPACTDKHERDWTPLLDGDNARVSYGHDVENNWLVAEACDAAGIDLAPYVPLLVRLFAYSRQYGYDEAAGGFYNWGGLLEPARDRSKVWWVQAEALVSALRMHRMTGNPSYLDVFEKTWKFVRENQIDWERGEWYETVTPSGRKRGEKGGVWKAAYHNGRAMMECIKLLREMKERTAK
jgi:mannobiose 2-epimerase